MKKSIVKRLFLSLPELEEYYRNERFSRYDDKKPLTHVKLRANAYPLFQAFLKSDRFLRKQKIRIMGEAPNDNDQVIFACTHIAGNDLENIYETIGHGSWLFVGDPGQLYKDLSGLLLFLNGCIFFDTNVKKDRKIAYDRAVELLESGGSLMIFPEGAKNITENLPVMKLYQGVAKMSKKTDVKIIPVAAEQYRDHFVINYGQPLYPYNFETSEVLTDTLRDTLATLKWEIWENEGVQNHVVSTQNERVRFREVMEKWLYPYDTVELIERTRFKVKGLLEPEEALKELDKIQIRRDNAFLFAKAR